MVNLQRGHDITRSIQRPGPIPVVSSSGISSYHNEAKAKGPGVILGRKGTLGKTYFVAGDYWPHDTTLWTTDFKGNDPRFIYYFFLNQDFRVYDVGSSNPTLNRNHVHALPGLCPPIAVQRRIAGVLGALDDLIDTNKRLISQLDDVAAAIFNRSITIPEFGRSGPGPGPSLSALRELCSIRSGYAFKSSSWLSDGTPVLQIRNVGDGFIDARSVKYVSSSTTAGARNFVARTGDILIAMTGYVGSVARVGLAEDGYLINQRVGRIESIATSRISSEVLYRSLRMPDTKDAMINVANGSAQANLSANDFGTITIAVPDLETQARVTHVLKVLDSALDELRLEQFSLVRTRDELLPVLLSGQLSVSEAR